jgi:hypothetical protein
VILESIPHVSLEEMIILQASWRLNPFYVSCLILYYPPEPELKEGGFQ